MNISFIKKIILAGLFIALGITLRIFFNEKLSLPNFEVITALSLLSGSFLGGLFTAVVPTLMIFVSDLYFGNTSIFVFTWTAFIFIGVFGSLFKRHSRKYFMKMITGGVISVLFFYLYTNFGWWLVSKTYPMNFFGLLKCYIAGLPFLRNQIISVLIFIPLFLPLFSFLYKRLNIKVNVPVIKNLKHI